MRTYADSQGLSGNYAHARCKFYQALWEPGYEARKYYAVHLMQLPKKPWVIEGQRDRCTVMVARPVVQPDANNIPVRVLNPRDIEVSITKDTVLAKRESVPRSPVVTTVTQQSAWDELSQEHNEHHWDMGVQAEQSLTQDQKHQLYAQLLEYDSPFATGEQDVCHTSKLYFLVGGL